MNIVIVGLGSIAKKHIQALNTLEKEFNIYALRSNINAESTDGVTNIFDLSAINFKIDFAIISNPTHLHYEYISFFVDKAVPLFIEKPPLSTLANAESLLEKINQKSSFTYVACNLRFNPCLQFLKNFISSSPDKRVNELNVYCGSYLPNWRPNQDFRTVYSSQANMGGGVHLDLFHELDYTHWIFGKPTAVRNTKRNVSTLEIDAVDYANYTLDYANYTATIILNYYRKDSKRTIEIVFEDETWLVDLIKNKITNHKGEIIFEEHDFNVLETYRLQMQYFIDCLTNNLPPMNNFAESVETLKICLDE